MKIARFIGLWAVTAALAAAQIPCMAAPQESAEYAYEAEAMEKAILAVKEKIHIPEELTEFWSEYSQRSGEDVYIFAWSEKNGTKSMEVECDPKGRISRYNCYGYSGEDNYVGVTRAQAQLYAEEFLRNTAPDAFADDNDKYVYEDYYCDYYSSGVSYTFVFARYHNGNKVRSNEAEVTVNIRGDKMTIQNAMIGYKYGMTFENPSEEITDPEAAYKQAFPLEMAYTDYSKRKSRSEWEEDTYLVYQTDAGYISAYTGEIVEAPGNEAVPLYNKVESTADMAAGAISSGGAQLSETELAEVEKIASFISEADSIEFLNSIPMLKISELDVAAQVSGLRVTDKEHNEYLRYFEFDDSGNDRHIYANVDAVRGRLLYYMDGERYRYNPTVAPESETEIAEGNARIDEFLELVASDIIDEFKPVEKDENDSSLGRKYERTVNGITYKRDSLSVDYSVAIGGISKYNLTYNNNAEFADPAAAVDEEIAYNNLIEAAPLEKAYVKFGDEYKLVYYLTSAPLIDALTGKELSGTESSYIPKDEVYTDIDNHWSKDNVSFLKDLGIAFEGPELNPDSPITQADILRIFAAATNGSWYMTTDIEDLYDRAEWYDAVAKEERNEGSAVTREQAFKYIVSFMNYAKVAKLPDIYKVKYADGDMLSDGMTGYAAILSGMGIINGDGSTIRPKDYITRAEALTMVYNYMTSSVR